MEFLLAGRREFEERDHMSLNAFNMLCDIVRDDLKVDSKMSLLSSGSDKPTRGQVCKERLHGRRTGEPRALETGF